VKTTVIGLFDDAADARAVLAQLAASPLDLDAVTVLHADPDVQRQMAREAGLPPDRALPAGLVTGALLGGLLGVLFATAGLGGAASDALGTLGPLLSAAGGVLLGALAGLAGATLSRPVQLPEPTTGAIAAAVDTGATALLVRTDNVPTAQAIRDLFAAGGAREAPPEPAPEFEPLAPEAVSGGEREALLAAPRSGEGPPPEPGMEVEPEPEHALFVPPWRRGGPARGHAADDGPDRERGSA
jgi:hypothetical protein